MFFRLSRLSFHITIIWAIAVYSADDRLSHETASYNDVIWSYVQLLSFLVPTWIGKRVLTDDARCVVSTVQCVPKGFK